MITHYLTTRLDTIHPRHIDIEQYNIDWYRQQMRDQLATIARDYGNADARFANEQVYQSVEDDLMVVGQCYANGGCLHLGKQDRVFRVKEEMRGRRPKSTSLVHSHFVSATYSQCITTSKFAHPYLHVGCTSMICGAAGSRTPVQSKLLQVFYMLST